MSQNNDSTLQHLQADKTIYKAFLRGRYNALTSVNRQLILTYYNIGRYLSESFDKDSLTDEALSIMSNQLKKSFSGLSHLTPSMLKDMVVFYQQWSKLNSLACFRNDDVCNNNKNQNNSDSRHQVGVEALNKTYPNFPLQDFLKTPFPYHMEIIKTVGEIPARVNYLSRSIKEGMSLEKLKDAIAKDQYHHQPIPQKGLFDELEDEDHDIDIMSRVVAMYCGEDLLDFLKAVEETKSKDIDEIEPIVQEREKILTIKNLILSQGRDFIFLRYSYHVQKNGICLPSVLFFNRKLNALVVIFIHLVQSQTDYSDFQEQASECMSNLDMHHKKHHENHPIGLLLEKHPLRSDIYSFKRNPFESYGSGKVKYEIYNLRQKPLDESFQQTLPDLEKIKALM